MSIDIVLCIINFSFNTTTFLCDFGLQHTLINDTCTKSGSVAQLDRAAPSQGAGWWFESTQGHQINIMETVT